MTKTSAHTTGEILNAYSVQWTTGLDHGRVHVVAADPDRALIEARIEVLGPDPVAANWHAAVESAA